MKGSQTEFEQQERLFAMLEQKNGEIKHLLGEIRNLEKFKVCRAPFKMQPDLDVSFSVFLSRFLYYVINPQFQWLLFSTVIFSVQLVSLSIHIPSIITTRFEVKYFQYYRKAQLCPFSVTPPTSYLCIIIL
jgi:hypothetical protein